MKRPFFPAIGAIACALLDLAMTTRAAAQEPPGAITVFTAKKIVTMDPTRPTATAVAIRGRKILSVGSLEVGKLADFAVLDSNPLTIDPAKIADIKVVETIKEGRTVYRRDAGTKRAGPVASCAESAACFRVASVALGRAGVIHFHDHED